MTAPRPRPVLDDRDDLALRDTLLARRAGYLPEWLPEGARVDAGLVRVAASYVQTVLRRLDRSLDKNELAFLDVLGIQLIPARAARAPIVFRLAADAQDSRVPAGTRVAAPPPPGRSDQLVFETERAIGLAGAKLTQVFSLVPGRDAYVDHSTALAEGKPIRPFEPRALLTTPHALYLAHDTLLALTGGSTVEVLVDLLEGGSESIDLTWEYWDGKVWREFKSARRECDEVEARRLDSTIGLRQGGRVRLEADCAKAEKTKVNGVEAYWMRGRLADGKSLPPGSVAILPEVDQIKLLTVTEGRLVATDPTSGVKLDKAFAGPQPLDVSQAFMPFGPQPGGASDSAFYFTCAEVFSKPGARFTIGVKTSAPAQAVVVFDTAARVEQHSVVWEYHNGREWKALLGPSTGNTPRFDDPPESAATGAAVCLTADGSVPELVVPPDIARVKVNGDEQLWMRVRVVGGRFGFTQTVQHNPQVRVFFPQPPVLADIRIGYTWQHGPDFPEHVITYNDFQYRDETATAKWPGKALKPFTPVDDITPALYLGFERALPVDALNLYIDAEEQTAGIDGGPALVWEHWDGGEWRALAGVEDETRRLRSPGMLGFIGPANAAALARFGTPLHWVRARLKEDEPPGEPVIRAIHPNAVWAAQNQTIVNEPLGSSTGQTSQVFTFRQVPVLEGQVVEVRELAGQRANVEWRIVALDVLGGNARAVRDIEDQLAADGTPLEIERDGLRFRRDRQKRVTEVWVRWEARSHLRFSGPDDRHYTVDRARGRIAFGDGTLGKVPPAGAAVVARRYRSGGGLAGNVAAEAISQILGAVGAVEAAFNPRPAQGGADGESVEAVLLRGPQSVRHRGRAVAGPDFETLAREASSSVAVARAIPGRDPAGRRAPGWVTVVIIPQGAEPRPWPTFGLREEVRRHIGRHAAADLVAADRIFVTGPAYVPVDVDAAIAVRDPATAGAVEQAVRGAIAAFLHPLRGGAAGRGWMPGRSVYLSDLAAVVERVPGVDFAERLALLRDGAVLGQRAAVPETGTVVAGHIQLTVVTGEGRP